MNTAIFSHFSSQHDDFVHDIAYDFYGCQLATASSDQIIKIWRPNDEGKWKCVSEIKAHSGSVQKLAWSHPEFGQIIASCSIDRVVNIYKEVMDSQSGSRRWNQVAHLVDAHAAVQDVMFAPRHQGLKLATCGLDGVVRVYESPDVLDLSVWPLMEEFEVKSECFCLCWNNSSFDNPMILIGTQKGAKIYQYIEQIRKWSHMVDLDGHNSTIHDVSWAPNIGRTFHLVATAGKDGLVYIWKLTSDDNNIKYNINNMARLDHNSEVWRIEWNLTGTILASSGDDGTVRLYKQDFQGKWIGCLVVNGQESVGNTLEQSTAGPGHQANRYKDDLRMMSQYYFSPENQ